MRKHAETFHTNKGYKLGFFIGTLIFSKHKFALHFSNVIWTKTRLCTPIVCVKVNYFNIVFHKISDIWPGFKTSGSGFSNVTFF